jgi:23S rRNA (guanosine2251-2'-O)-methyltransferase
MIVYGINPVLEALRARRVAALKVVPRAGGRVREILERAETEAIPITYVDATVLDREAGGGVHQGVVAEVRPAAEYTVDDLVRGAQGPPLIAVLDGIEDPHNVGAILRAADAAGADGVVRQARHAAPLGGAAAKASAGAIAHVRIATVVNIARALEQLNEAGVWTVGLATDAALHYDQVDLRLPTAVVLGAEGVGLRRVVRERCEVVASIPMHGHVDSLNVSVAAGIVLFEALRQRQAAAPRGDGTPGGAIGAGRGG